MRRVRASIATVEKLLSFTQCECVCVALDSHYAMRMRHIVILLAPRLYNIFLIISSRASFLKEKKVIEHKICFDLLYTFSLNTFLIVR